MAEEKKTKGNLDKLDKQSDLLRDDNNLDNEAEDQKEPEKKVSKFKWFSFFLYFGLILLFLIFSVIISVIVVEYKKNDFQIGYDQMKLDYDLSKPKDVYIIPEFKLALDKQVNDLMTTIVQIQLAIAYEKGDQKTLTEIIHRKEQIKDRIQYIIASKNYDEINTARSREEFLKEDILYNLNNILNGKILDIYFDTFVISRMQD